MIKILLFKCRGFQLKRAHLLIDAQVYIVHIPPAMLVCTLLQSLGALLLHAAASTYTVHVYVVVP